MIYQSFTNSFKLELFQAIHAFQSDTLKIALYTDAANLGPSTTAYTASGEVSGTGYVAGGATLTASLSSVTQGATTLAYVDFADVSWPSSTITARGALVYNSSKSNKSIMVLNFGHDRISSASTFPIVFPPPTFESALIRL